MVDASDGLEGGRDDGRKEGKRHNARKPHLFALARNLPDVPVRTSIDGMCTMPKCSKALFHAQFRQVNIFIYKGTLDPDIYCSTFILCTPAYGIIVFDVTVQ